MAVFCKRIFKVLALAVLPLHENIFTILASLF